MKRAEIIGPPERNNGSVKYHSEREREKKAEAEQKKQMHRVHCFNVNGFRWNSCSQLKYTKWIVQLRSFHIFNVQPSKSFHIFFLATQSFDAELFSKYASYLGYMFFLTRAESKWWNETRRKYIEIINSFKLFRHIEEDDFMVSFRSNNKVSSGCSRPTSIHKTFDKLQNVQTSTQLRYSFRAIIIQPSKTTTRL